MRAGEAEEQGQLAVSRSKRRTLIPLVLVHTLSR